MSDRSPPERSLKEKEISRILRRAAEMQGADDPERLPGLTLEELKQIAADSGIDPVYIERAASEVWSGGEATRPNLWGGPVSLTLDRTVDHEIDMATWEQIVSEARRFFKESGSVSAWGQALEWTMSGHEVSGHVTAVRRKGRTRIQVRWSLPVLPIPFFVVSLLGSILALPIVFESLALTGLAALGVYVSMVVPLLFILRTTLATVAARQRRRVRAFAAKVEQIARDGEGEPAGVAGRGSEKVDRDSRIDPSLLDPDQGSGDAESDGNLRSGRGRSRI